jgi:hypothetical protein
MAIPSGEGSLSKFMFPHKKPNSSLIFGEHDTILMIKQVLDVGKIIFVLDG